MEVILLPDAQKQYIKLPPLEKEKVIKKLRALQASPLLGKKLSGQFNSFYSIRAWPYRIIYKIVDQKIQVVGIGHRQGVYK